MGKAAWKLTRKGDACPGMTAAQQRQASRRLARGVAHGINLRYDTDIVAPVRGGSYLYCPRYCGWRARLTAKEQMRRFRRHYRGCPERPRNKRREIPHLKNPPRTILPSNPPVHLGMDKRVRPVETVELPA